MAINSFLGKFKKYYATLLNPKSLLSLSLLNSLLAQIQMTKLDTNKEEIAFCLPSNYFRLIHHLSVLF